MISNKSHMQVILLQTVPGLGQAEAVKEVAEGYARNFLFPRHLAVPASTQAVTTLAERQKRARKEIGKDLQRTQALAQQVDGLEVEFKERVSVKGVLYAALTAAKVAAKLRALGFAVEAEQLIIKPLKELGAHPVKLKFRHGLEAEITVVINK